MDLVKTPSFLLSDAEEELMAKMKNSGSDAWSKLQKYMTSTLLVDISIDGEDKKLHYLWLEVWPMIRIRIIVKTAYEAELKAYDKIAESSAAALKWHKGKLLHYATPVDMNPCSTNTLESSRMDKETLDVMLLAMMESLPSFQKYFRKKAELLGLF